jgi:hypothetical protein
MKGPVARAGSMSKRCRIMGIRLPNSEAKIITVKRAMLTVSVSAKESLMKIL